MILDTLDQLEARIHSVDSLDPGLKHELETLLVRLRGEVLASGADPALLRAVQDFESQHPQLTLAANSLATSLANIGI